MPGKGRRVASRQAQLGQRRKRQNRGPSGTPPATEPETKAVSTPAAERVATEVQESAAPPQNVQAPASPRPATAPPQTRPARARADFSSAYIYVVPELRRIGILSGALLAVLIALSFFI